MANRPTVYNGLVDITDWPDVYYPARTGHREDYTMGNHISFADAGGTTPDGTMPTSSRAAKPAPSPRKANRRWEAPAQHQPDEVVVVAPGTQDSPMFTRRYPWADWFKLSTFTLIQDRDYNGRTDTMAQQIRNAAARYRIRVRITIADDMDSLTCRVLGRRKD